MYAVIETGGKQYRVELGSEIAVERLDVEPGETLDIERVLLVADGEATAIGRPLVDGARVSASVVRQDRADKVVVFKYKPKTRRRVKHGHRQDQTLLRVSDIVLGDRSAAGIAEREQAERARQAAEAAQAAEKQAAADKELAARLARESAEAEATAEAPSAQAPKRGAASGARTTAAGGSAKAGPARTQGEKPAGRSRTAGPTQAPEPEAKPRRPGPAKKDT